MDLNTIDSRLSSSDYSRAEDLCRQGSKLSAIKLVREKTGCDLKDAKDYVETRFCGGSPSPAPKKKQGCYVATCVYGSYDCPEVWVLRRYRDNTLNESLFGRAFIRLYYAVSPTAVRLFGHTRLFKRVFRRRLDRMVARLRQQGVEDTPYSDLY